MLHSHSFAWLWIINIFFLDINHAERTISMENVSSNGAFFIHGIVFILQTKEQLHASLSLSVPSYSMVNLNLIITRVLFISGNQPIHLGNVECNSFRDKSIPNHIFHVKFFLQLNIKKIIIWFWNKLNRIKGAWHSSLKLPIQKGRIQHALWCTHIAWFYWVKIGILNGI